MSLPDIRIHPLRIPLRAAFEHAGASRDIGESVLVHLYDAEGFQGAGEGCPRSYVSGETVDSCIAFFNQYRESIRCLADVKSLRLWISGHRQEIDANPAAFCAMETAWLDYHARRRGVSLEELLELPSLAGCYRYSAVLGSSRAETFSAMLEAYQQRGFVDYKVKLFGDPAIDGFNTGRIRDVLDGSNSLRFDANNNWDCAEEAAEYMTHLNIGQHPLEEPLKPGSFDAMRKLQGRLATRIILDESCRSRDDLENIACDPHRWIVNIRVSRMGGILRSLEIARTVADCGIPLIVGAQVGETSLLTRAALTVANAFRPHILFQEGGFGTQLLAYDIVTPSLMFDDSGLLCASHTLRVTRLNLPDAFSDQTTAR